MSTLNHPDATNQPIDDLYRREVLDARKSDWLGSVHLSAVRLGWPMAVLATTIVLAVIVALNFGAYARKESVTGRLVPVGGLLDVAATTSGVITHRLVSEGQLVTVGQALVEISPDIDVAEAGGAVAERIGIELDRRMERLRLDLGNQDLAGRQQQAALQRLIESLQRQLVSIDAEFQLRRQQAKSSARTFERIQPLWDRRALSDVQVQQYEDQALNARASLEIARRSQLEIANALAEAQHQLNELPLTTAARRSDIEGALAEIAQLRARNLAQQATVLKAPMPGVVSGLAVEQGQTVGERQRLLSIIPEDTQLRAELWAPSQAIGKVDVGDEVAIRYHSFPYQTFGHQRGRVIEIAGSPLSPEDVHGRTGIDPGQPAFRILVDLDRQHVPDGTQMQTLRAGMSLDADLIQERRHLYEWLIAPVRARTIAGRADPIATERR
jgi:membrane fusion protein